MAGLSINVNGASWDEDCVIGSGYPKPAIANLATFGTLNFSAILGQAPTKIGSPQISNYYFNGDIQNGYNLNVNDNITKTMMILLRPSSTTRFFGIGNYLDATTIPQGDTLIFEPGSSRIRAVVGRSVGTASAPNMDVSLDTTKFHLVFLDVSDSSVQIHRMSQGTLISAASGVVNSRAIPSPNMSILAGAAIKERADFLGKSDIAMTGVWSGSMLTNKEKETMCSMVMSMFSSIIPVA